MDIINNNVECKFFKTHKNSVRSVAFNPRDRYIFCSSGNDGLVNLYHAGRNEMIRSHIVSLDHATRSINACTFTCDGSKIITAALGRRVSVIDVEKGTPIICYDHCSYNSIKDRTPLACHPQSPNIAACSYVNGKGLAMLDLRMPLPLDFVFDFHTDNIREIAFLHESWPFSSKSSSSTATADRQSLISSLELNNNNNNNDIIIDSIDNDDDDINYTNMNNNNSTNDSNNDNKSNNSGSTGSGYTILSISSRGQAKVTSMDGRLLHSFDYGHSANSIAPTPEHYDATHDGFQSAWICGGDLLSSYVPSDETLKHYDMNHVQPSILNNNNDFRNQNQSWPNSINNNNSNNNRSPSSSSSSSFNVIINPNNLNLYRLPRRNDIVLSPVVSSIDTIRIHRAIRSIVSTSQQHVNNNNNPPQYMPSSSSSSASVEPSNSSSSSSTTASMNRNRLFYNIVQNQQQQQQQLQQANAPLPWSHGVMNNMFEISSVIRSNNSSIGSNTSSSSNRSSLQPNNSNNSNSNLQHQHSNRHHHQHHHNHRSRVISVEECENDFDYDDEDDDDEDDDDDDDDDDDQDGEGNVVGNGNNIDDQCNLNLLSSSINHSMDSILSNDNPNQQSNHHQQQSNLLQPNSFIRKNTLFYHDHWDRNYRCSMSSNNNIIMDYDFNNNNNNGNRSGINNQNYNALNEPILTYPQQINCLKFSSNGAHLYVAGEGGYVRQYRRYPHLSLQCLGTIYRHRNDVMNMDISPYDEFLVTASKDKTVGLYRLGSPSHGWTEYYEYT